MYPRSYGDANGDGVGDLEGLRTRLDHLAWLGVGGVWLNPTMPSPNADWGYDVSDYTGVDPALGTLDDLDRLVAEAGERGIRVVLDLVPNHTSDRHPWFEESRRDRRSKRRGWYVWADGRQGGRPPNNWRSVFGGPAWTWDERAGQWYLHGFLSEQPDLDWWNGEVRDEFDRILRFWLGRGVAGVRIDCAHRIVKDAELRDNPPATESDPPRVRAFGQRELYTANQPGVHDVLRRWRRLVDGYDPPRLLLGEAYVLDLPTLASYYGELDELQLAFNFALVHAPFEAEALRSVVAATERELPAGALPAWTGSNHDAGRLATRWCAGDERRVRCALLMLLTLRGTPVLYAGDEIGLPDVEVPRERLLDPVGVRGWPDEPGRDRCRTPMHWTAEPGAGFTRPGVEPWLPLGDVAACNVAAQRGDPRSTLAFCRDAIALRRAWPALRRGGYAEAAAPGGVWAWRRGEEALVVLNLQDGDASVAEVAGEVALSTDRRLDGERVDGTLGLAPWQGAVLRLGRAP